MQAARYVKVLAGLLAAAVLGTASGEASAGMQISYGGPGPRRVAGEALHPGTGLATLVAAPAGEALPGAPETGPNASPDLAARAWLGANAALFGLDAEGAAVERLRAEARPGGASLVRYRQTHRGVPVFGAQLNVAVDGGGRVVRVTGETVRAEGVDVTPAVDAAAAREAALSATAEREEVAADALTAGEPQLVVYDPVVFDPGVHDPGLAWQVEVASTAPPLRELVLVDARDGSVRLAFNQIDTARNRMTYDMNNSADEALLPGTLRCNEANPTCAGGDADEQAAHVYAGDTYDYFSGTLGRDGIDGAGMTIVSSAHFGTGYQNAFWNGAQMVYGDGFSQADDVVGHELAHGVMQHTANLFYWAESGAINESYSDLHGEFVDLGNTGGTDTAGVRWLMGEDVPGLGAIRNMANPPAFGDPDRMGSPNYYDNLFDNVGVHTNSGVNNKAVYLLTDGDSFNGQTVSGIGIPKVAWLYYVVQRDYLTPASNYVDLAAYLRSACTTLAGTADHGFTAGDCTQVENALLAVEMDQLPGQHFVDATDAVVKTKGMWATRKSANALYGTFRESRKAGNVARVPFQGNRVTVYYLARKGGGVLDVYLDRIRKNTKVGTINQSRSYRRNAWALEVKGLPDAGPHTLILKHRSGSKVNFDAVAYRQAAEDLPILSPSGFPDTSGVYAPGNIKYLTYGGLWNNYPYFVDSLSWRRGDTVSFSFTGDAFVLWMWLQSSDGRLGKVKLWVDGIYRGAIDQRDAFAGTGYYYLSMDNSVLSYGRHTVRLKHASGTLINLAAVGVYDLP